MSTPQLYQADGEFIKENITTDQHKLCLVKVKYYSRVVLDFFYFWGQIGGEKNLKTKMEPRRFIIYFSLQTFSFVFASKVLTEELFEIPRRVCLFWEVMFLSCYTEHWAEFSFIIVKIKTNYCHVYCEE